MKTETSAVDINRNIGDFSYDVTHAYDAGAGLSEKTIHYISDIKEDPDWVREFRLKGQDISGKANAHALGEQRS